MRDTSNLSKMMEEPNNSKMDLNKKGVKVITSQFIDLGLPEDRKPMSISN